MTFRFALSHAPCVCFTANGFKGCTSSLINTYLMNEALQEVLSPSASQSADLPGCTAHYSSSALLRSPVIINPPDNPFTQSLSLAQEHRKVWAHHIRDMHLGFEICMACLLTFQLKGEVWSASAPTKLKTFAYHTPVHGQRHRSLIYVFASVACHVWACTAARLGRTNCAGGGRDVISTGKRNSLRRRFIRHMHKYAIQFVYTHIYTLILYSQTHTPGLQSLSDKLVMVRWEQFDR